MISKIHCVLIDTSYISIPHGVRASFDGMLTGVCIVFVQITPTQITHLVANIIGDESFMKKSGIKVRYI